MKEALNAFATAVFTGPLELRVRHFEALSMLFRRRRESQACVNCDLIVTAIFSLVFNAIFFFFKLLHLTF